jgi:hypothetical protein
LQKRSCKWQLALNFAGEDSKTAKPSLGQSKKQCVNETGEKDKAKYVCLECLELHLRGKLDDKYTSICCLDKTSIQRHKNRWHQLPGRQVCTFVPGSSHHPLLPMIMVYLSVTL